MSMTVTSSWLAKLNAGDEQAAQKLWEDYYRSLVRLARKKLQDMPRRAADEDDVANSALKSFCLGMRRGQFPRIAERDNLWRLLVVITVRKASELKRRERRAKRGSGAIRGESALVRPGSSVEPAGLDQLIGLEPSPEMAFLMAEQFQQLLQRLENADLQRIARWKMENYSNDEIAGMMECSRPTVERKLRLIRTIWETQSTR